MCGLYSCSVRACCRDYKISLSDNIVVFVHSLDAYERFRVELDLVWFDGSKTYLKPYLLSKETIDVKWSRLDRKCKVEEEYDDEDDLDCS